MRKLSIIIPVLGPLEQQENSLVSVLQNRPADTEVLVVLNRPYDDPYDLAGEVRFLEARRRAGLVECVNLGIRESEAPIVHLLACGVETVEDWTTSALRHFRDPQVAAVAPLILSAAPPRQIVAAGISFSRGGAMTLLGQGRSEGSLGPWASQMLGPSWLGGFFRKSALAAAGGFDRSLGHMAAVDLAFRLREMGHRLLLDPQSKMLVPGEWPRALHGFRAGLEAERMFLRHVPDGSWIGALCAHFFVTAGDFFRAVPSPASITQLCGRAFAWSGLRRQRQIQSDWNEVMTSASEGPLPLRGTAIPRPHISLSGTGVTRDAA